MRVALPQLWREADALEILCGLAPGGPQERPLFPGL